MGDKRKRWVVKLVADEGEADVSFEPGTPLEEVYASLKEMSASGELEKGTVKVFWEPPGEFAFSRSAAVHVMKSALRDGQAPPKTYRRALKEYLEEADASGAGSVAITIDVRAYLENRTGNWEF